MLGMGFLGARVSDRWPSRRCMAPAPFVSVVAPRPRPAVSDLDSTAWRLYSKPVHMAAKTSTPKETTYTSARANLAALCSAVAESRDAVIIHRRGAEDVALVAAAELSSLME